MQFPACYYNFTQVMVKAKTDGSTNTIFYFQCPGNSTHSQTLLLMRDRQVNRKMAEVCSDQFVRVAFNQWPGVIEVRNETTTMMEYPMGGYPLSEARSWEILSSFFATKRLSPLLYD